MTGRKMYRNLMEGRRTNNAFTNTLQRKKEPPPPTSRLSGLNYAMLTESALKKKLKDLGIPSIGSKPLLVKRHQEWLNLWNSNCDAAEHTRKSKRELLRELDEWERTQGAQANNKESHIMRKDFDGQSHAVVHKSHFDDLIAAARKKRATAAPKEEKDVPEDPMQQNQEPKLEPQAQPRQEPQPQPLVDSTNPYEGNEDALSTIRDKVEEANRTESVFPPLDPATSKANYAAAEETQQLPDPTGFPDSFASPTRKVPMFSMPEEPVVDVESTTVQ